MQAAPYAVGGDTKHEYDPSPWLCKRHIGHAAVTDKPPESQPLLTPTAAFSPTTVQVTPQDPAVCAVTLQSRLPARMAAPPQHGAWAVAVAGERQPEGHMCALLCCSQE